MRSTLVVLTLLVVGSLAQASRVGDIKDAVKKACGKELKAAEAVKAVKVVYGVCNPGSPVEVAGCEIKCMKDIAGVTVGGN